MNYPEKYLWDVPMAGLKDDLGQPLEKPQTLREMRLASATVGFDIQSHIDSEDGRLQAQQWRNVITCADEMAPQVLAYWAALGWKKELHNADCLAEKWSCLVPLSSLEKANENRRYPLYFVLHGGTTPPYEMEGYGLCEPTAADEPIIIIPQNFTMMGVLELYRYAVAHYPVDQSRVYAISYCGGNRSSQVALRYPELFAAIAPCGNPLRENYKPILWYPDYERLHRLSLPCIHIDGLEDLTQLLPVYHDGDPALSDDPHYPGRISNMPLGKREYKVNCLRDFLYVFNCKDVTKEEVFACESSADPVLRAVGAPCDETEVITVHGKKQYVARFIDRHGKKWTEIVAVESVGHFPDATMGETAWQFLRRFRRNRTTGQIEEIGAANNATEKLDVDFDRYLHDAGSPEWGYNSAWTGHKG